MKRSAFIILFTLLAATGLSVAPLHGQTEGEKTMTNTVKLSTTLGEIEIELYPQEAPVSVRNFVEYVESGHFDDLIFHRVIPGFVIQGGGFTSDMRQRQTRPPIQNEAENGLKNLTGTLSMARTPDPHSATSQFFINLADNAFLDHTAPTPQGWGYAVFARVTGGMDVVEQIAAQPTGTVGVYQDVPLEPIVINRAEMVAR